MQASIRIALLAVFMLTALQRAPALAADATSPIGMWTTFDDKTGAARAIVRIYEQDGKLFGKIVSSFTAGADNRLCLACKDDRKNQPIIGLIIIRDMKPMDGGYGGGDILDPDSGAVYRCQFHVENGNRLLLRGYIGISLLGRTQTWQRQSSADPSPSGAGP